MDGKVSTNGPTNGRSGRSFQRRRPPPVLAIPGRRWQDFGAGPGSVDLDGPAPGAGRPGPGDGASVQLIFSEHASASDTTESVTQPAWQSRRDSEPPPGEPLPAKSKWRRRPRSPGRMHHQYSLVLRVGGLESAPAPAARPGQSTPGRRPRALESPAKGERRDRAHTVIPDASFLVPSPTFEMFRTMSMTAKLRLFLTFFLCWQRRNNNIIFLENLGGCCHIDFEIYTALA